MKGTFLPAALTGSVGRKQAPMYRRLMKTALVISMAIAGSKGGNAQITADMPIDLADFDTDGWGDRYGRKDLAAFTVGTNSFPVATSNRNGTFTVSVTAVPGWAVGVPGVRMLKGDFNGDGFTDVVAVGGAGWNSIQAALSTGNGSFTVTNSVVSDFPGFTTIPGVRVLSGDFNGDRKTDLAAFGGAGWSTIPVAFSTGNGSFTVTNLSVGSFADWTATRGVRVVTGDFDGDRKTDLAAVGGPGWSSIPVAFSNGNGTFRTTNSTVTSFPAWAATPGSRILTGDFNGDGKTDLYLFGVSGWATVRVAISNGDGTFAISNSSAPNFGGWASTPGVRVLKGDFDGDGLTDLAAVGGSGWRSIPIAFANLNRTFQVVNFPVTDFGGWAATPGVQVVPGDFDSDGRTDLAAVGAAGWQTIPVAFSRGRGGTISVTNAFVPIFPQFVASTAARIVTGNFH